MALFLLFVIKGTLCEISACQTLPTEDQCQNGGTCFLSGQGQPDCLCSLGFGGDRCSTGEYGKGSMITFSFKQVNIRPDNIAIFRKCR